MRWRWPFVRRSRFDVLTHRYECAEEALARMGARVRTAEARLSAVRTTAVADALVRSDRERRRDAARERVRPADDAKQRPSL